jgi:hypothetical protein
MLHCFLEGLADDRHVQAAADYFGDVSKRHALLRNGAGEHIADEQGFVEGAVDTGQSAARIVM